MCVWGGWVRARGRAGAGAGAKPPRAAGSQSLSLSAQRQQKREHWDGCLSSAPSPPAGVGGGSKRAGIIVWSSPQREEKDRGHRAPCTPSASTRALRGRIAEATRVSSSALGPRFGWWGRVGLGRQSGRHSPGRGWKEKGCRWRRRRQDGRREGGLLGLTGNAASAAEPASVARRPPGRAPPQAPP